MRGSCPARLVLNDYTKAVAVGIGAPTAAMAQEITWAALTGCAVLAGLLRVIDTPYVFALWAFGGGLIGVSSRGSAPVALAPGWRVGRAETPRRGGFGAQFLLTTGSAQLD